MQELARLDEKRQIRKTIRLNDLEETLSLDSVDLEADFRIFREADINRVAWIDRYQTDTLLKEEGPFSIQVTYKALDAKLKVQEVAVQWDTAGQVSDIRIRKRVKSLIAKSEQQLHYQPAHGYEIQAHQQRIFSKGTTMEVEVAW